MHKKHLLKVLGISLLAVIGAMAVSASAAQAKWLILVGTRSFKSIELKGTVDAGKILVPGLLALSCTGGPAIAGASTEEESKKLSINLTTLLSGCVVKDATGKVNSNCTVNSLGEPAKSIKLEFAGVASMSNALDVSFSLSSSEFAIIEINGALCSLAEFDGPINGAASLTMQSGADKQLLHVVHLNEERGKEENSLLFYEENEAALDFLGSMETVSGNIWALALVGL